MGEPTGRESFSEQQARFAKKSLDVGLVRAEFQCLQGKHGRLTLFPPPPSEIDGFLQRKSS